MGWDRKGKARRASRRIEKAGSLGVNANPTPLTEGKTSGSGGRLGSPSSLLCESCLLSGLSVHGCNMGTQESLT